MLTVARTRINKLFMDYQKHDLGKENSRLGGAWDRQSGPGDQGLIVADARSRWGFGIGFIIGRFSRGTVAPLAGVLLSIAMLGRLILIFILGDGSPWRLFAPGADRDGELGIDVGSGSRPGGGGPRDRLSSAWRVRRPGADRVL